MTTPKESEMMNESLDKMRKENIYHMFMMLLMCTGTGYVTAMTSGIISLIAGGTCVLSLIMMIIFAGSHQMYRN